MRRWRCTSVVVNACCALQRAAAGDANASAGLSWRAAHSISTASMQPCWPVHCTAASPAALAPASGGYAASLAWDTLTYLTHEVSMWLAAPKRKVRCAHVLSLNFQWAIQLLIEACFALKLYKGAAVHGTCLAHRGLRISCAGDAAPAWSAASTSEVEASRGHGQLPVRCSLPLSLPALSVRHVDAR